MLASIVPANANFSLSTPGVGSGVSRVGCAALGIPKWPPTTTESENLVALVVIVDVDVVVNFDGDGNGDMAAPTLTLREAAAAP
jgi:hypothetical protein